MKTIITKCNKIPNWRILRRGEKIREGDLQYTIHMYATQLTERYLVECNCTSAGWIGKKTTDVYPEYARSLATNLFYRKIA